MILLDTHIFIWWVHDTEKLTDEQLQVITAHENEQIGVSLISVWEIAKLHEYGRLDLSADLKEWFNIAKGYPGICILNLTEEIVFESTNLPGEFHKDPADQMIVATARINNCPLVTSDRKIRNYSQVITI